MDNVFDFPGEGGKGGGPKGPTIDQRVAKLEERMEAIDRKLFELLVKVDQVPRASDLASVKADTAEIKGRVGGMELRLSAFPTAPQLVLIVLTTWAAGAGMVFTLLKYGKI